MIQINPLSAPRGMEVMDCERLRAKNNCDEILNPFTKAKKNYYNYIS